MSHTTATRRLGALRLGSGLLAGALALALAPAGAAGAAPGDPPVYREATRQAPAQSAAAERAAQGVGSARTPAVRWGRCGPGLRSKRAQCATVQVPLDYDAPRGRTTPLALLKYRASQPGKRLGSLFVNPGGPGGEARGFATVAGGLLGPAIDRRFDVIGVDPRGVGGSRTASCRGRSSVPPFPAVAYPIGAQQVTQQIRRDRALRRICAGGASTIVDHASTADNARDMELLRRALGDRRLNYYGISYGSYLGQTYAALFPQRIRALAIDGVLDPIAWSSGPAKGPLRPFTWRLRSGQGAYRAITAAFAECDRVGTAKCDLAPSSATQWRNLLAQARDGGVLLPGEEGEPEVRLSEQDLVSTALSVLYSAAEIKPFFSFLADLRDLNGTGAASRADRRALGATWAELQRAREERERRGPFTAGAPTTSPPASSPPASLTSPTAAAAPRGYEVPVAFQAVGCSDSRNPRDPRAWERAARVTRPAPWFGRLWTWASSPCAERGIGDGSDSFRGPWRTRTSTPLLIVGNNYDPATPVRGARRANTLFAGSGMLFYDGYGHGNLGENRCVTEAYRQYFVFRKTVRNGSTCTPDRRLFG